MSEESLIQHTSESFEWHSPEMLVSPCRAAMGGIDLDPASCPMANLCVGALHIFSLCDNGLEQQWWGNVFLNPPYGTTDTKPGWSNAAISFGRYSRKEIWVEKFLQEFESGRVRQGILVLTASTGDAWFHRLIVPTASCMCFPRRIPFIRAGAPPSKQNGQPGASVVVYFGAQSWQFALHMAGLGWVIMDWVRPC